MKNFDSSHSPTASEVLKFLDQVPLLAGLNDAALTFIASNSADIHFKQGSVIFQEGDFGKEMYFVFSGEVQVIKNYQQPDQCLLAEIKPNHFFGEMCLLETLPRSATVITTAPTRLIRIASLTLLKLYEKSPQQYSLLVLNIARDLSRRVRTLNEQNCRLILKKSE